MTAAPRPPYPRRSPDTSTDSPAAAPPPPPAIGTVGWIDLTVADVDAAAARCTELGGRVLVGPKGGGGGRYCVFQDPAGAVAALYQNG